MNRKEFTIVEPNGKEVKLSVRTPVYEDSESADKVYATKVAQLIRESGKRKLLLRSELDKFLKETGVWTEEDQKTIDIINADVDAMLSKLKRGGLKLSEGRKIAIDVLDKRKEIVRIMNKRQIFDDTTIEAIAENEKNDFMIFTLTVHAEDGTNYWESFEDMKNDKISDAYSKASVAVMEFVYGINTEFEQRLPENRWLKKYNFINEKLQYTDRKTGEQVDKDGKPLKQIEANIQKRLDNLQGEIVEETPFIDDDTNENVVVVEEKKE